MLFSRAAAMRCYADDGIIYIMPIIYADATMFAAAITLARQDASAIARCFVAAATMMPMPAAAATA